MAVSTSPFKSALSALPTRTIGTGVSVGVGTAVSVTGSEEPDGLVDDGDAAVPPAKTLQLVSSTSSVRQTTTRTHRLMVFFILAKQGGVKQGPRKECKAAMRCLMVSLDF
jgi:hypothetical protein